jgi:hypothetical protein
MRYEFRNADGRICCSSDNPNNLCDRCKARAAGQTPPDYSGRGLPRTLTAPNPYRAAMDAAPYVPVPADDPRYQPHGTPPDGHALALLNRQMQRERGR